MTVNPNENDNPERSCSAQASGTKTVGSRSTWDGWNGS